MSMLNIQKRSKDSGLQAPSVPQVNLIPGDIKGSQQEGQVNRWIALSLVLALLVVGVWYWTSMQAANDASEKLDAAIERQQQLNRDKTQLSYVPRVYERLDETKGVVATAMYSEILWQPYVDALTSVMPDESSIIKITVETDLNNLLSGKGDTQYLEAHVGTLVIETQSKDLPVVRDWLNALQTIPGVIDIHLNTANAEAKGDTDYYYTDVTANFSVDALALRFDSLVNGPSSMDLGGSESATEGDGNENE